MYPHWSSTVIHAVRSPANRIEPTEKRMSCLKKCALLSLPGCILRQRHTFFKKIHTTINTAIPKNRYKLKLNVDSWSAVKMKSIMVVMEISVLLLYSLSFGNNNLGIFWFIDSPPVSKCPQLRTLRLIKVQWSLYALQRCSKVAPSFALTEQIDSISQHTTFDLTFW